MMSPKPSSKPEQYKKGWVEFYKLKFRVTPDVLIPRPETELLVDNMVNWITSNQKTSIQVIDIGTGSGNIAISLACNLGGCNVNIIATDVSEKALKVAKQNARFHGIKNQITFIQSDLLNNSTFNTLNSELIIVANLPYIPSARIPILDSSVKDFEPLLALDGGKDGFELYRKLFSQIKEKKWKPALMICEIDHTHENIAQSESKKYFPGYEIEIKKDLAKNTRILKIIAEETH